MNALEFETKLKKLNPRLYLGRTLNTTFNPELLSTGIYCRDYNPSERVDLNTLDYESLEESSSVRRMNESPDGYFSWCTWKHVPEGNQYTPQGKLLARGWREILLKLASCNLISLHKARRVFNDRSLGESSYDKLNHQQKVDLNNGRSSSRLYKG